jgi:RHS repeat-associated protein
VKARADYEPFGALIAASTTGPLPREQFTGQQRDSEVGLDYFGARFYHATHGRMLSVDPLYVGAVGDPQRWNRYAHVLNSPLNALDPDGRRSHYTTTTVENCGSTCFPTETPPQTQTYMNHNAYHPSLFLFYQYGDWSYQGEGGGINMGGQGTWRPPATATELTVNRAAIVVNNDDGTTTTLPPPDVVDPFVPPLGAIASAGGRAVATTALIVANRAAGLKFENALGWVGTKGRIVVDGVRTRIPDYYNEATKMLGEAKNVTYLRMSSQLRDMAAWAKENGWTLEIHTTATKIAKSVNDLGVKIWSHPKP